MIFDFKKLKTVVLATTLVLLAVPAVAAEREPIAIIYRISGTFQGRAVLHLEPHRWALRLVYRPAGGGQGRGKLVVGAAGRVVVADNPGGEAAVYTAATVRERGVPGLEGLLPLLVDEEHL